MSLLPYLTMWNLEKKSGGRYITLQCFSSYWLWNNEKLFNCLEPPFSLKGTHLLIGRKKRIKNIGELGQPLLTAVTLGSVVSSLLCSKSHTAFSTSQLSSYKQSCIEL